VLAAHVRAHPCATLAEACAAALTEQLGAIGYDIIAGGM